MEKKQQEVAVSRVRSAPPKLAYKILVAAALWLTASLLWGQAPGGGANLLREDVDAQGFKYLVPNPGFIDSKNKIQLNQRKLDVRKAVTSSPSTINDPATRQIVDQYYQQYFFPMMTMEEGLKTIAAERQNFMRDLAAAKDPAAHAYLANLALAVLSKVVPDNYRLAARYNAMLIISSLNDVEPSLPQTLPEPMRAAQPFIFQQFTKADNPDPVRLAALLGLGRHLEFDSHRPPASAMPAALKSQVLKELVALAQMNDVPEGRDPEVHLWFRRRAIESLGLACAVKPDAEVTAAMQALLVDESAPLPVRAAAAAALGKMVLDSGAKIEPLATAKELGYLALLICDSELTKAENFRKTDYEREGRLTGTYSGELDSGAGGPGMPGMPGMRPGMPGSADGGVRAPLRAQPSTALPGGGEYGSEYGGYGTGIDPSMLDPKHYRMEYIRRRIRQQLYAVQLGLTGGEDFTEPKGGKSAPTPPADKSGGASAAQKKGVLAIAKANERDAVLGIYYKVRRLVELVESTAKEVELPALVKTMRSEMKNLEAITKRLPPPGTVVDGATGEEGPAVPAPKAKTAGPAKGKAPAGKKGPAAVQPKAKAAPAGKAAFRPPAAPVFGRPNR